MKRFEFLRQFFQHPLQTGAIKPSSQWLAREMVRLAEITPTSTIVEFGPGTGVFTEHIAKTLSDHNAFLAMEINEEFAQTTRQRCPQVTVIHDSAVHTRRHLEALDHSYCDSIVSGLPWAAFESEMQDSLLAAAVDVLRPGGRFITFAYLQGLLLPAGIQFKRKLNKHFAQVGTSPVVWRNLPPALVYWAIK